MDRTSAAAIGPGRACQGAGTEGLTMYRMEGVTLHCANCGRSIAQGSDWASCNCGAPLCEACWPPVECDECRAEQEADEPGPEKWDGPPAGLCPTCDGCPDDYEEDHGEACPECGGSGFVEIDFFGRTVGRLVFDED